MAFVRVEQRNARLASAVKVEFVKGRDGEVAKGTVTIISNTRRGSGDAGHSVRLYAPGRAVGDVEGPRSTRALDAGAIREASTRRMAATGPPPGGP